jgi:hypothetical protein
MATYSVAALVQDTSGVFYGTAAEGASTDTNAGTVFGLSVGLVPFVETEPTSGRTGATVDILGTNLTGVTSVTFNRTPALLGAPEWSRDSKGYQGAPYVYANVATGCIDGGMSETSRLLASDGQASDELGSSVSISGGTIVVGAPQTHNSGSGAVYVYTTTAADWTNSFQIAKLTASDGVTGDRLGTSVSMQGGIVAAGAPSRSDGSNQGAVYIYTEPAGGWQNDTEAFKLTASDGAPSDLFGISVAVSGNTTAIGASGVSAGTNQGRPTSLVLLPITEAPMTSSHLILEACASRRGSAGFESQPFAMGRIP